MIWTVGKCQGEMQTNPQTDRASKKKKEPDTRYVKMKNSTILLHLWVFSLNTLLCGGRSKDISLFPFLLIYCDDKGLFYSHTTALTDWSFVQKCVNIFICLIVLRGDAFNSDEQKPRWGSLGHSSPACTPQPLATVPNLCNWTWDIRMGGADARCILKIVLSHWTLS